MSEGRITGLDSMILIPPTLALLAQVAMLKTFGMHLLEVEQEELIMELEVSDLVLYNLLLENQMKRAGTTSVGMKRAMGT